MRKGWNQKGQYYLVAAMIISALIITIAAVTNYSRKGAEPGLEELKDEILIESAQVLDYTTNNQLSSGDLKQTLLNFTSSYLNFLGTGKSFYFIFGNSNEMTVSGYQESDKVVLLESTPVTSAAGNFTQSINPTRSNVTLYIDEEGYDFEINPGENFYFVLSDAIRSGEYIVKG